MRFQRAWLLVGMLMLGGCNPAGNSAEPAEDAARSPNATILPTPFASSLPASVAESPPDASTADVMVGIPADSKGRLILPEAGPIEVFTMLPGQPIEADKLTTRDVPGLTLVGEWVWSKLPPPTSGSEVSAVGIDAARKLTRRTWLIELTESGRMRLVFNAASFPLTQYTELRARIDYYGHALVWPDGQVYRTIAPGALRALIDERRVDVTPLIAGRSSAGPKRGPRFGFPTAVSVLSTPFGKLTLEQARTPNASLGGQLLCRTLVELAAASPMASECETNSVPVHAEYAWPDGTTVSFNVSSLQIRSDFSQLQLAVPPAAAIFSNSGLPPVPSGIFLTREQVGALRTRALESSVERKDPEAQGAPGEGFVAVNDTDALRYVLLDGVPVAWVPAHGQQYVIGTVRGRYTVQWRSFLGTYIGELKVVEFPAKLKLGGFVDAGAPTPPAASSH